jgi:hypothetical protein
MMQIQRYKVGPSLLKCPFLYVCSLSKDMALDTRWQNVWLFLDREDLDFLFQLCL